MQSDLRWSEHVGRLWSCGSFHLVWGLHAKLLCSLLLSLHQGTQSQPSEFRLDQQLHCQLLPATLPNLSKPFQTFPSLPISFHLFSVFPHHIFSHSGISRQTSSWCLHPPSSDTKPATVTRIPPSSLPKTEETDSDRFRPNQSILAS